MAQFVNGVKWMFLRELLAIHFLFITGHTQTVFVFHKEYIDQIIQGFFFLS